jgi:sugar phosphate isomerase/epimerase
VLRAIGYEGYVSAECFPYPDPDGAARLTIDEYRAVFAKG